MQLNFYYKHKIFSFICFDFMHRFFLLSVQCLMFFYCHSKTSVPKTKSHSRQKYKKRIPSAIFDQKSLDLNGWKSHSQVKDRVQIKISTNSQTVNWIWIKRFELTQQWTSNRIKRKILVPRKPTVWVRIQIVCCSRFEIVIVKLWRSEPDHEKKNILFCLFTVGDMETMEDEARGTFKRILELQSDHQNLLGDIRTPVKKKPKKKK